MPGDADLLIRYAPRLRYDSQENYFADSPAIWTDSATNVLRRAGGEILAYASPGQAQQRLSLDFLRAGKYPDPAGSTVEKTDCISHPKPIELKEYQALHKDPRYRNRMYGRVAEGGGARWLQYWFFYFYNDAPSKLVGYGKHEGDWEMVQLRLGAGDKPDLALFAQHKNIEVREWRDVEKTAAGETPVVYTARGSHASYFEPGRYGIAHSDRANGKREAPPLVVETIRDKDPGWALWPGVWGDTQKGGIFDVGESSPRGPSQHKQWRHPDALLAAAAQAAPAHQAPLEAPPPHPSEVSVTREAGGAGSVSFALPAGAAGTATHLLVTVNSPDDKDPPTTHSVDLPGPTGTIPLPVELDDWKRFEIEVSTANEDGVLSDAVRRVVRPAKT